MNLFNNNFLLNHVIIYFFNYNSPIISKIAWHNNISVTSNTGNQKVSLRSFSLFRSAAPVSCRQKTSSLRCADTMQPQKNSSLKISNCFFALPRSSSSHVLYPAFVGASASIIPLHFVTVIRLLNAPLHSAESALFPFSTFQQY